MNFREPPSFGTGLDPLEDINMLPFLTALQSANLDTDDLVETLCWGTVEAVNNQFGTFESLCDRVHLSCDDAVEAAKVEGREFEDTGLGYTDIRIVLPDVGKLLQ
ncbi:hypothetical protein FOZ61_000429 [Perkinsus olseni]|uniref:Uncharacterized protein n=1 Tax=Perkinsus olseni TaxID=32597 RepID=A0A7J6KUZ1_PEROL|nr:hypothetical protein FOZ61_000429 [Perkinsus olseni]KAF4651271.1 hypothetical protein FOL46_000410 [Perkinsus olseni]